MLKPKRKTVFTLLLYMLLVSFTVFDIWFVVLIIRLFT